MTFRTHDPEPSTGDHLLMFLTPILPDPRSLFSIRFHQLFQFCFVIAAKYYISAASSHVCSDGYRAWAAGLGYDLCLFLMELGIKHLVADLLLGEHTGKQFRYFNRGGTEI